MAYDTARAYQWVVRKIAADATILALLAGDGVYRRTIPRGVDLTTKPAIAVNIQSSGPPSLRAMIRGSAVWADTPGVIKTKIVMQTDDDSLLEPVADRLDVLLDGQVYQDESDATVFSCAKGMEIPTTEYEGDVQYQHLDTMWAVSTKVG